MLVPFDEPISNVYEQQYFTNFSIFSISAIYFHDVKRFAMAHHKHENYFEIWELRTIE